MAENSKQRVGTLGPRDRQRLQPETKKLGGRGLMAPFSTRREGIDDDDDDDDYSRRATAIHWWEMF